MVISKNNFFVLIIFSLLLPLRTHSQEEVHPKDTTLYCFRYRFNPNDTLVYLVHSYDSIIIDYGKPLLKVRNEIHRVICENVTKQGTFILSYKLIQFQGRDFQDTTIVDYTESDWLNREIKIEIDSFGNRINFWVDDTLKSGRTPGGPFQPHMFFPFQDTCKKKNETWLVRSTDDLAENGIPIPRFRHTMLFKMIGEIDTLGEKVIRSEFIRTGQGSLKMQNQLGEILLTAVINSYGYLDVSKEKSVPIHLFTTVEQKLNIKSDENISTGKHFIHSNYTLIEYHKGKVEVQKPQKRSTKKSKR
ncbi:MAG: hypothetical protein CH6_1979 [Candidatus Kapaibacterium sp.]|jgi:hypothetical protein|nr:MAG: hypothetical protein CH6_1979 [Candidatus Kapabacteria bacterium]ROL57309.1 MAG: hypothetical protein D9V84_04775 [Bacteroidetes/Chlorobi group bacterium Naka2016]